MHLCSLVKLVHCHGGEGTNVSFKQFTLAKGLCGFMRRFELVQQVRSISKLCAVILQVVCIKMHEYECVHVSYSYILIHQVQSITKLCTVILQVVSYLLVTNALCRKDMSNASATHSFSSK